MTAKLRAANVVALCRGLGPHDGIGDTCAEHTEDAIREAWNDALEGAARQLENRAGELDGPWGGGATPEDLAIARELRRMTILVRARRMK